MSTLLEQASLVMIPSGYKEDVVYSQIPTDGSGDLSFTRASNGTRVNSAGLVEVTPWNLLQQSNSFSTSPWILLNATLTSGQTGYDGTANAWRLNDNATNGRHIIIQTPSVSGQVTFTIYAKANASNFLFIRGVQNAVEVNGWFNLSTGALGTIETNGTGAIESVGNGWYKCSLTIANFENGFEFYVGLSNANGVLTYSGGSGSIFIQNAQLNIGSTAKPYFPTTDRLNVPRLTYQNGGGGCPSLLLEKQSTNILTYSEQFDNSAWTASSSNATVTANDTTSPDGTQNADKVVFGASGYLYQDYTIAAWAIATISIYCKTATQKIVFGGASPSGTDVYSSVSVGNGWYRQVLTRTFTSGGTGLLQYLILGNNETIYVWGAQLEASSYPTSYIPTTSSSATRVADACYKTGISSLIGQSEGTVFVDYVWLNNKTDVIPFEIQGSNGKIIWFRGVGVQFYGDSTTLLADLGVMGGTYGERYKLAFVYGQNDFRLYKNGSLVGSVTSGTFSSGFSNVAFNVILTESMKYNEVVLFKNKLTNAELASLTTI